MAATQAQARTQEQRDASEALRISTKNKKDRLEAVKRSRSGAAGPSSSASAASLPPSSPPANLPLSRQSTPRPQSSASEAAPQNIPQPAQQALAMLSREETMAQAAEEWTRKFGGNDGGAGDAGGPSPSQAALARRGDLEEDDDVDVDLEAGYSDGAYDDPSEVEEMAPTVRGTPSPKPEVSRYILSSRPVLICTSLSST